MKGEVKGRVGKDVGRSDLSRFYRCWGDFRGF